jgi:hypothetical protein
VATGIIASNLMAGENFLPAVRDLPTGKERIRSDDWQ